MKVERHTDRAPDELFPFMADPADQYQIPGALTRQGEHQAWMLGEKLNERYIKGESAYLDEAYNPFDVWTIATYMNRSFMGDVYELRAMYPNGKTFDDYHTTAENYKFTYPFKIQEIDESDDYIFFNSACIQKDYAFLDAKSC
eukprot:CAMPEP_0202958868 /NCGR_PEP_ID=MMETSP1396-20130829/3141_1 /ASSEMBLY_ACC=CAM_ASM_000872 /TAXON_ID= /ORGANISM="Pseudokeronopsis sp., Strain Brazil" /LENGTH=142 /DNA_ID=CAMNT_0049677165 /DNA_START=80 /DNA_END=508 /DNA_ORIENTATION=+